MNKFLMREPLTVHAHGQRYALRGIECHHGNLRQYDV